MKSASIKLYSCILFASACTALITSSLTASPDTVLTEVKIKLIELSATLDKLNTQLPLAAPYIEPHLPTEQFGHGADIEQLNERIKQLQAELEKISSPITVASTTADENNEQVSDRYPQSQEDLMNHIEFNHSQEDLNGAWAKNLEAEIRSDINNDQIKGISLKEFDCRSETCKVELSFSDMAQSDQGIELILNKINWDHEFMTQAGPDSTKIFFSREGGTLTGL
jgi:hypothetical protein